jgi:peptidoglycan-N-acetylglucosamine deacetylase
MKILGLPVRQIISERNLYLTFDDGPEPGCTEKVLKLLNDEKAKATFFVVARKAQKYSALIEEITSQGHTIGNHSLDHGYSNFFRGKAAILEWIEESENILRPLAGLTVGFRPPAGVRTPELAWALKRLALPLILWNQRFFDTRFSWTPQRARRGVERVSKGSIILLHDRQPHSKLDLFLESLRIYIQRGKEMGFEFEALTRKMADGLIIENPRTTEAQPNPDQILAGHH